MGGLTLHRWVHSGTSPPLRFASARSGGWVTRSQPVNPPQGEQVPREVTKLVWCQSACSGASATRPCSGMAALGSATAVKPRVFLQHTCSNVFPCNLSYSRCLRTRNTPPKIRTRLIHWDAERSRACRSVQERILPTITHSAVSITMTVHSTTCAGGAGGGSRCMGVP